LDTKQILSPNNYLFYNAGLSADSCEITKKPHVAGNFKSIYHLFDHGTQPPYNGILPNLKTQDSVNLANINSINQSVFSQLSVNDVWSNYEYFGSTWIDPTTAVLTPGNGNIGSLAAANLRGSRALSNIAAETYFQYNYFVSKKPIITRNSFNCFTCHNTSNQIGIGKKSYPFIIGLSHLFNNNLNKRLKSSRIEQPLIFQEK
jgi:hypothetical protein